MVNKEPRIVGKCCQVCAAKLGFFAPNGSGQSTSNTYWVATLKFLRLIGQIPLFCWSNNVGS